MTTPAFAIIVNFEIDPDHFAGFRDRVIQQANDSMEREPGCHRFDVLVAPKRPNSFVLYEIYADEEAFETHCRSEHFAEFSTDVDAWVITKEVRQLNLLPSQ